ncbi:hypothetical protein ACJX0J_020810, partial [Zea mays]
MGGMAKKLFTLNCNNYNVLCFVMPPNQWQSQGKKSGAQLKWTREKGFSGKVRTGFLHEDMYYQKHSTTLNTCPWFT